MDLSHWDLVDSFTLWEGACLASNFDPLLENPPPAEHARALFFFQHMEKAYSDAEMTLRFFGPDPLSPDETVYSMFPDFVLPSIQLVRLANSWIREGDACNFNWKSFNNDGSPRFSRKALADWFSARNLKTAYTFLSTPDQTSAPSSASNERDNTEKLLSIRGETFARLKQALNDFPSRYGGKRPKLDDDVRPWLKESLGCSDREAMVFGAILAEHFRLPAKAGK